MNRLIVEDYAYTSYDEPEKNAAATIKSLAFQTKKKEEKLAQMMTVPTLQSVASMCKPPSSKYGNDEKFLVHLLMYNYVCLVLLWKKHSSFLFIFTLIIFFVSYSVNFFRKMKM